MSMTDEQIETIYKEQTGAFIDDSPWALHDFSRAIESAATAPLLERIAELERHNKALVDRRQHDVADIKDGVKKLDALERELEAVRKDAGWRPIETAPDTMTGTVVVRWVNSDGEECRELDYKEDGCWIGWHEHAEHVEIIGGHGVSYTPPYTGWMPLPPPPDAAKEKP